MSSSSSYHDSLSSETSLQASSPPDAPQLTNDGRRAISHPENTAKRARLSRPASTIETALRDDQHIGAEPSSSFSGPFALTFQMPPSVNSISSLEVEKHATLECAVVTLRRQRMDEYKQDIYIAPLAKPSLQAPDENVFSLMENVVDFLAGDGQVMLILGDSGAGKSTFNRYLEHQLWQDYKTDGSIPLSINLPSLQNPEKELVAEQLRTLDFTEDQIRELKLHRKFTLVCDGYDESRLTPNLHTTNSLNQPGQWNTKLIITCRSQYLGADYQSRFVPDVRGRYFQTASELFREAVIAPFSKDQIEDYVEQYVPLEPRPWVTEDYMDKLRTIPNLMDLVKNPFLLSLCLEALPSVIEGETDLPRLQVTRVQLYDNFVRHWMGVNKRRLQRHRLSEASAESLGFLLDDGFEKAGVKFQQDLAVAIFQEQEGRPVIDYTHRRDKGTWKAEFFGPDPEATLLRGASLLNRNANKFRFVHRSVLEYFYSCTIFTPINTTGEADPKRCPGSHIINLSIANHSLSRRNLVNEPSIVQFLAERVRSNSNFEQHLHALIERSKTHDQASRAAANAITILVRSGVRFNGADLRGILISGADLSAGQFDNAQFQGADLTGVNFTKSWLRQADFTDAQMEGVQFGELAYLEMPAMVISCDFSPDGKSFAVGLSNGDITMYDTPTWIEVCTFQGHQASVRSLVFSPSGDLLLTASDDTTVRLWDLGAGRSEMVLEGHGAEVTTAAFSPSRHQIASGSLDKSLRLWDIQSNPPRFISISHSCKVYSVAYSPDGLHIAFRDQVGVIRIFNTDTGSPQQVIESGSQGICRIAYSPDGQRIVTGNREGKLQFWTTKDGKPGPKWKGHGGYVSSVVFSPNAQWIASSSNDHTVKLWNAQTGVPVSSFSGHTNTISSVAFSPDSSLLASSSWDTTVRIWQMDKTEVILNSCGTTNPIRSVGYSPNGRFLLTGTLDGRVCQYDSATGVSGLALSCGQPGVRDIAYSTDGLRFATVVYLSCEVKVRNAGTGVVDLVLTGHTRSATAIAFSTCGDWIATGSYDATIRLWDAHSGTPGVVFSGHTGSIRGLFISASGSRILSGSWDGTIRVWDMISGEPRVLISEDQIEVFVGKAKRSVAGSKVSITRKTPIVDLKLSPSCRQIASLHYLGKDVLLWEEETGEFQQALRHDFHVECSAFSSCGQWIATGGDKFAWLWNSTAGDGGVQEWKCVSKILDFFGEVNSIAWRPDTLEFATGCKDGSVRAWRVRTGSSSVSIQLVWSAGPDFFVATKAAITDTVGLSDANRRLLLQRGATDEFLLKKA